MTKLRLQDILLENDRLVSKSDITNLNIRKWNSMGLKPYYFNDNEESDDFGMIPITEIPEKSEDNFIRDIFLLSDSDMEKIGKMVENVKNLVTLYKKKISLIKEYIKSVALEGDNQ